MANCVPITLFIKEKEDAIELKLSERDNAIQLLCTEIAVASYDEYTGAYIAIPKTTEQYFNTKNKLLKEDFKVEEIPYEETHNAYGITAVIAS